MALFKKEESGVNHLNFCIELAQEKIPGEGEDSYYWELKPGIALAAVFDGCGGAGAKRYSVFGGKTGAFVASRLIAGTVEDWFKTLDMSEGVEASLLHCRELMKTNLDICYETAGRSGVRSGIKNSLAREFPTTAAMCLCRPEGGALEVLCVWAGDSRCYALTASGLRQLSEDDLSVSDSMENLSADAVLTNVICQNKDFELHAKQLRFEEPCLIFNATDGCFGYELSPMHFEYSLLSTLAPSRNADEWEGHLKAVLCEKAGDDLTFCGLCYGFGSFEDLKKTFAPRLKYLFETYIRGFEEKTKEERIELWQRYKTDYAALLRGE